MAEKDDLGLSLSLSFPQNHHSLQLNLMPSSGCSTSPSGFSLQKTPWNEVLLPSSGAFCLDSCNFHGLKVSDLVKHACFFQKRKKNHFFIRCFSFFIDKKNCTFLLFINCMYLFFFFFLLIVFHSMILFSYSLSEDPQTCFFLPDPSFRK